MPSTAGAVPVRHGATVPLAHLSRMSRILDYYTNVCVEQASTGAGNLIFPAHERVEATVCTARVSGKL